MVGGELRKLREPPAITESKTSSNSRCLSHWSPRQNSSRTGSKNTSLKGLTLFIARNVSSNAISEGKLAISSPPMIRTSSENTGDVMVENTSMRLVWRTRCHLPVSVQRPTCRDQRTLSREMKWTGISFTICSNVQPSTCRDRRTLSRERLNLGSETESNSVYH